MTFMTWWSIAILGPGAVALFVWFLFDVRTLLADDADDADDAEDPAQGG